jgi:hypothetical protein
MPAAVKNPGVLLRGSFAVRRTYVLVTIAVVALLLSFAGIKLLAVYWSPDPNARPLPPVDKEKLHKPQTIGQASCCLHDGDNYCATAFHAEINGIRYYAARKQRACFPANVATERQLSPQTFKMDDPDHCSCRVSTFVRADLLFKTSLSEEEVLVSGELQLNGLKEFVSPTNPLLRDDGARKLEDFVVSLDGKRFFRLFKIESWSEAGQQPATRRFVRFGQELDPRGNPKPDKEGKLVDSLGYLLKIQVGEEVYSVLAHGEGTKIES